MTEAVEAKLVLLSDDPALVDLLSFDAVAHTVADALLDDGLDPIALGLSSSWGSGKTTVLNLIEAELERRTATDRKVLVIRTDPWRYDPTTGAKESFIAEVLTALGDEVASSESTGDKAKNLLARLSNRIHWAKALKLAATTSITLQVPSVDQLVDLVKPSTDEEEVRGLEAFRGELGSTECLNTLSDNPDPVYTSDGDPTTITIPTSLPEALEGTIDEARLEQAVMRLIRYDPLTGLIDS